MTLRQILLSFLPLISVSFLSDELSFNFSLFISIFLSLLSYKSLMKGFILDWGILICLILSLFLNLIYPTSWFESHFSSLTSIFLSITTFISIFISKPFTMQYAKTQVDKKYWSSPLFLKINKIISLGFALFFLLSPVLSFTFEHLFKIPHLASTILSCSISGMFILFFPKWVVSKKHIFISKSMEKSYENSSN